jgi:hypothetical protein
LGYIVSAHDTLYPLAVADGWEYAYEYDEEFYGIANKFYDGENITKEDWNQFLDTASNETYYAEHEYASIITNGGVTNLWFHIDEDAITFFNNWLGPYNPADPKIMLLIPAEDMPQIEFGAANINKEVDILFMYDINSLYIVTGSMYIDESGNLVLRMGMSGVYSDAESLESDLLNVSGQKNVQYNRLFTLMM